MAVIFIAARRVALGRVALEFVFEGEEYLVVSEFIMPTSSIPYAPPVFL
jgi:hypothetical protein